MPTTLISSSWAPSTSGELQLVSRELPNTLSIHLSAQHPQPSPPARDMTTLSTPLLPLTLPRQVDGHMGNIVRGLIGADGNSMTASTELEEVVPRFFKTRGESPQPTSAWALVTAKKKGGGFPDKAFSRVLAAGLDTAAEPAEPKPLEEMDPLLQQQALEGLWREDPPHWNKLVQQACRRGARLHKVLSGGGGWGKKAGLLSLDPKPVGPPQRERTPETDGDFDSVDEFSTALKPVINDGDYIQFFISPAAGRSESDILDTLDTSERETKPWSWEFGVVPSTIDSIPGDSLQSTSDAPGGMAVHRGTFGALTEAGLTLMRTRQMDEKSGIAETTLATTTIDVPFARWSALRLVAKAGVELKMHPPQKPEKTQNSQKSDKSQKPQKPRTPQTSQTLFRKVTLTRHSPDASKPL